MKPYLDIMNYFGYRTQMKKLNEECYEFLEAVDNYEDLLIETNGIKNAQTDLFRDHVIDEMGDMLLLLTQFIAKYNIAKEELDYFMDYKLARTGERIRTNYYKK